MIVLVLLFQSLHILYFFFLTAMVKTSRTKLNEKKIRIWVIHVLLLVLKRNAFTVLSSITIVITFFVDNLYQIRKFPFIPNLS